MSKENVMSWQGKQVAIIGFGIEGEAALDYLIKNGAKVTVCDKIDEAALGDRYTRSREKVEAWQLGADYLHKLKEVDAVFMDELYKSEKYYEVGQAFAVLTSDKSVGVVGDGRSYDYVVALRSVDTTVYMTAEVSDLGHEFLCRVANRIINEVKGVGRVVYDITSKPPGTIEWE